MKPACDPLVLTPDGLDDLMPMHLRLGRQGEVLSAGRTLRRMLAPKSPAGRNASEFLRLRRPARGDLADALVECAGAPLRLELRGPPAMALVGISARTAGGGALLNLSFGIGLADAVRRWALTMDDFAPTDLAAETLFLVEANGLMLDEAHRLAEDLDAAHEAARRDAATDPLTGLANRRALIHAADALSRAGTPFVLLSLDLDRFKAVNDRLGHEAGDVVLREVAGRLQAGARRDDLAVRLGGDEFVLLLRGTPGEARLSRIASAVIRWVEKPIDLPGGAGPARISASIGTVRSAAHPGADLDALLRAADRRLYRAKRAGGARAEGSGPQGGAQPAPALD